LFANRAAQEIDPCACRASRISLNRMSRDGTQKS
jgi:hypothetical protein